MAPSRTAPAVGKLAKVASGALAAAGAKLTGDTPTVGESATVTAPVPPAQVSKARATVLQRAYRRAEKRVDAAKEALDAAKADIVEAMGAADVLQVTETGKPVAELKSVESLIFDQARFRTEHPTEASEYMKPRVQRRFRLLT